MPLSSFVPERSTAEDVAPVAAVILSFNSESTLAVVLDRVAAQTVRPARTIVVDNGSVDGTQQLLSGAVGVEALLLGTNCGVGAGHNAGWARRDDRSTRVGFVWALEHDTFPAPDCLERLLTSFDEADSTVPMGAAIPAQQTAEGTRTGRPTEPIPTRMLHFNGALLRVRAGCGRPVLGGLLLRARGPRARAANRTWRLAHALGAACPFVHANYRNVLGNRSTVFRRYYGWRNDLWLRINVRKEPWARLRAVAAAGFFVTRSFVRERRPWPEDAGTTPCDDRPR